MVGRSDHGVRRAALLGVAVAALLGLAAAGGSLIRGSSKSVTAGDAFPYALLGAASGLVVFAIVVAALRAARPAWIQRSIKEWAAIAVIAAALGALIGALLTPHSPTTDEVSPLDEREIDERRDTSEQFGEQTRAGTVDFDRDGRADVDDDGNVIIGYDLDGDGRLDGILESCPPGTPNPAPRPGYTPIDNECDGTIDSWLPFDPDRPLLTDLELPELDLTPPVTISPQERQSRADSQGASGKLGESIRNVLLILLAVAIGAAVIAVLVRMPDRHGDDTKPPPDDAEPLPAPPELDVSRPIEDSLAAMLADPDPRQAICAAYGRLLDGLADAGLPRRPEEGPEEHIVRCLTSARIDASATGELLRLFTLARFSTHPIDEAHRAAAIGAMRRALASAPIAELVPAERG